MDKFDLEHDNDIEITDKEYLRAMIILAIKTLHDHDADQFKRNWVASALGDALVDNEDLLWS